MLACDYINRFFPRLIPVFFTLLFATASPAAVSFGPQPGSVIFAGDTMQLSFTLGNIETFAPLFGSERSAVNPAPPRPTGNNGLCFEKAGEYYLDFGEQNYLRILVLDPSAAPIDNVIRIFDYFVANILVCNGDQDRWDEMGLQRYFTWWSTQRDPALLLCGPTSALFQWAVEHTLGLPTRMVTLPGVTLTDGVIVRSTHNIPEVYIPEFGKFVLFDLNNNFIPQWLDASEVAEAVTAAVRETGRVDAETFARSGFVIRQGVRGVRDAKTAATGPVEFAPDLLSNSYVDETRTIRLLRTFHGGVAYFGNAAYGTGFLPANYVFASLHTNLELERNAVDWIKGYGLEPIVVSMTELRQMLDSGFSEAQTAVHSRLGNRRSNDQNHP